MPVRGEELMLRWLVATLLAIATFFVTLIACADDAPAYTLEVDSDAADISFDTLAPRLAKDLGGPVRRAGEKPTRASITIHYRDETRALRVRVLHSDGQAVEREVKAEGEVDAVQREAVLLAGNLARDEARELLDELSKRPPPPPPPPPAIAPPAAATVEPDKPIEEERTPFVFSFVYPVATNWNHPNVATSFTVGLLYTRTARVDVLGFSSGVIHATKSLNGANFAAAVTISGGDTSGFTGAMGTNIALGRVSGVQAAMGFNLANKGVSGLQLSSGANVAGGETSGAQAGVVNVGDNVAGAQIGVVNIAKNVKGAQVGVVNIAENVDAAVGLVSISKDALHPIAWASNLEYTNAGVKFSTKYVYTLAAIGFGTNETKFRDKRPATVTLALGAHVPLFEKLDVEPEIAYTDVDLEGEAQTNRALHLRALPGWAFAKHLRVFAGGGMRIPLAFAQGSTAVRPEALAGIQF